MAGEGAIGGRGSGGHRSGGGGSGSGERPGEILPDTDKRLWDGAEKDGWEVRRLGVNLRVWSGKGVRYPSVQAAKDAMGLDARYGVILPDTDERLWEGAEENGWEVRRMGGASRLGNALWEVCRMYVIRRN